MPLTLQVIKQATGLMLAVVVIVVLLVFRTAYIHSVGTAQETAQTLLIARRQLAYAYFTGNLDPDNYKPIPRSPVYYQWDGFTPFGEMISTHYNISLTSDAGKYPLSSYINAKGYTYKEAVFKTAGVLFMRVYVGEREMWVSVKR